MSTGLKASNIEMEDYEGYSSRGEFVADLADFEAGRICGGKNSSKKMCRKPPRVNGNGRCARHGGTALRGSESPNFTHGGYSRHIPKGLLENYNFAQTSEDLLSVEHEIHLVRSRVMELISKTEDGGGKKKFSEIYKTYEKFLHADPTSENYNFVKGQFFNTIEDAYKDIQVWDEIYQAQLILKRLIEQQHKKMIYNSQYIEVKQVISLLTGVMGIFKIELEGLRGMLVDNDLVESSVVSIAKKIEKMTTQVKNEA